MAARWAQLSLTASKAKYRKGFGPLLPDVHHVPYGDVDAIEHDLFPHTAPPEEVAGIFVESVLGEGGYIVPPPEFLRRLRALCDRHGILLVLDEVQSGMGRTGRMFATEHVGVRPDVLVLGKGLASGMPLGAMLARRRFMTWARGSHGSTFAGNPVCIAAALATLDLLEEGLIENAARVEARLKERLQRGLASQKIVEEVRGVGLMIGVEFATPELATAVANLLFRRGLIVLEAGTKAIRISPPLIISPEQADTAADLFIRACRRGRRRNGRLSTVGRELTRGYEHHRLASAVDQLPPCMPKGGYVHFASSQYQRNGHGFQVRQQHADHGDAQWPRAPSHQQACDASSHDDPGAFGPPRVVAGKAAKLDHACQPAASVTGQCGQNPVRFTRNQRRLEDGHGNQQRRIKRRICQRVQSCTKLRFSLKPASQETIQPFREDQRDRQDAKPNRLSDQGQHDQAGRANHPQAGDQIRRRQPGLGKGNVLAQIAG